MIIKCPRCGKEDVITFKVEGYPLTTMVLNFRCTKCGMPGAIFLDFIRDVKDVSFADLSYIG